MSKNGNRNKRNQEVLLIKGAREHNLKNIDVSIPRNMLTVITGAIGVRQELAGI